METRTVEFSYPYKTFTIGEHKGKVGEHIFEMSQIWVKPVELTPHPSLFFPSNAPFWLKFDCDRFFARLDFPEEEHPGEPEQLEWIKIDSLFHIDCGARDFVSCIRLDRGTFGLCHNGYEETYQRYFQLVKKRFQFNESWWRSCQPPNAEVQKFLALESQRLKRWDAYVNGGQG